MGYRNLSCLLLVPLYLLFVYLQAEEKALLHFLVVFDSLKRISILGSFEVVTKAAKALFLEHFTC